MELAGVLIAVLLLIFLIYKRLSLIPATLICVAVLALTNGFSYMDLFINHYGVSLAGFVGKYFLVFVTNALFGKVMEETLLASVFSKMIGKLFGDKNAVVISTLHGVKGEEYTTVIAAGLFIVTGQSPSLLGMDKMLQEWKGADQFIIVKGTWFEKLMAE